MRFALWTSIILMGIGLAGEATGQTKLYVNPLGKDTWTGTLATANKTRTDGPLKSLQGARDAIRKLNAAGKLDPAGAIVTFANGNYFMEAGVTFTAQDSGTTNAPIIYQAGSQGQAILDGGKQLAAWRKLSKFESKIFDASVQSKVMLCNVRLLKMKSMSLSKREAGSNTSQGAPDLFFDGQRMKIASYPTDGFATVSADAANSAGQFKLSSDTPTNFSTTNDIWAYGYLGGNWYDLYAPVTLNSQNKTAQLSSPAPWPIQAGYRYRIVNVMEQIKSPGDWAISPKNGNIYFYPPVAPGRRASIAFLDDAIITVTGASNIQFNGFTLQNSRKQGVVLSTASNVVLQGCTIRNIGTDGVKMVNGSNNGLDSCNIYNIGETAVILADGSKTALSNGNSFVVNCDIHTFGQTVRCYRAGILIQQCGNYVANNDISDCYHEAIGVGGNNQLVEKNHISHVCQDTDDAGAIYTGREFTSYGNIIRQNVLEDIPGTGTPSAQRNADAVGVYLDDMASGFTVTSNVFRRVRNGILMGGGRWNTMQNNVFDSCNTDFSADDRGLTIPNILNRLNVAAELNLYNVTQPPYSTAYPSLTTFLSDEPTAPKYNSYSSNVSMNSTIGMLFRDNMDTMVLASGAKPINLANNYSGPTPGFQNPTANDFRLLPSSPLAALGFSGFDSSTIGLQISTFRPNLTVTTGRPKP